jgi:hypothetical protein
MVRRSDCRTVDRRADWRTVGWSDGRSEAGWQDDPITDDGRQHPSRAGYEAGEGQGEGSGRLRRLSTPRETSSGSGSGSSRLPDTVCRLSIPNVFGCGPICHDSRLAVFRLAPRRDVFGLAPDVFGLAPSGLMRGGSLDLTPRDFCLLYRVWIGPRIGPPDRPSGSYRIGHAQELRRVFQGAPVSMASRLDNFTPGASSRNPVGPWFSMFRSDLAAIIRRAR